MISNQDVLDAVNSNVGDAYSKAEADGLYYSQTYLNSAFSLKLNSSLIANYSTTSQSNDLLDDKVAISTLSNYNFKTDVDTWLGLDSTTTQANSNYYNKTVVYTKSEVSHLLNLKLDATEISK